MDLTIKRAKQQLNASPTQDADGRCEQLMDEIASGRLGTRIREAARLAYSQHLFETAQYMQSAVEAENSTHIA